MRTVPSPLLKRLGLFAEGDFNADEPVPSGTDYVHAWVKDVHHKTIIEKRAGTAFEFKGLKVQNHYN